MKLKVVDDYRKVVAVEADTIEALKARIMESFSLSEEDLSQRLLVRDGRDIYASLFISPMVNGFDLLELEEEGKSIILEDYFCEDCLEDGDTLLLGWKGPFIISLVPTASCLQFALSASFDIEADPYVTLGDLKAEIERRTGELATKENLPRILADGDDNLPLIFFGFYKYFKGNCNEMVTFRINRNRANQSVFTSRRANRRRTCYFQTKPPTPDYSGKKFDREVGKNLKVGKLDQYGRCILIPFRDAWIQPKKKKNKGMEGDNKDTGPSYKLYQASNKEMENIDNLYNDIMKQQKEKEHHEDTNGSKRKIPLSKCTLSSNVKM